MDSVNRREAVVLLGSAALTLTFRWTPADVDRAARAAGAALANGTFAPKFFTPHEWETVRLLVDLIIPADARSGSATDAGVPEFMDFMMMDRPHNQPAMRKGLTWLDGECQRRFQQPLTGCTAAQRKTVLDLLAWPDRAPAAMKDGVNFFNGFRDLTASGFWSTKMGVEDLQYMGNTYVQEWKGCPDEVLKHLGLE